jgi:hypothetical protein
MTHKKILKGGIFRGSSMRGSGILIDTKKEPLGDFKYQPSQPSTSSIVKKGNGLGKISAKLEKLMVKPLVEKSKPKNISFTL